MAITSVVREAYQSVQDDLVRLAQQGDASAFGRLIHGRLSRLHASAVLIVRNPELGQDAVQEALYFTTLVARALISATLLWLLLATGDPFFAVILVIVLVGVALTGASYLLDRRDGARS